jgi:nicotinamide-nucleotide amidase
MWETAVRTDAFAQASADRVTYVQHMLRLFGIPESEIAETLRRGSEDGIDIDSLEITTCLRRAELEIVTRYEPAQQPTYDALVALIRDRHSDTLFSDDGTTVDDQVAALLRDGGLTIATAESCTGGLVAARLTELPGSSDYVNGGMVVYANPAKVALAGVDPGIIEAHGAVSVEVAKALADGARAKLGADVGIGVTGIAGPGGGSEEKPVGLVCLSVAGVDGARLTRAVTLPGRRVDVRDRSTTIALHMARRLLRGETDA